MRKPSEETIRRLEKMADKIAENQKKKEIEWYGRELEPGELDWDRKPTVTVTPDREGWFTCPKCGFRIKSSNKTALANSIHVRCGQRLEIIMPKE